MNHSKLLLSLSCFLAVTLTSPLATAAPRGGSSGHFNGGRNFASPGRPGMGAWGGTQYGSPTRSKVAELQRRLARAGYYRGSVDGVLGPQTRRAIRAYEQDHGYADAG